MNDVQARCGRCGAPMLERAAPTTGRRSMRCSRYPDCRETTKLPAYLQPAPPADVPWWVTP